MVGYRGFMHSSGTHQPLLLRWRHILGMFFLHVATNAYEDNWYDLDKAFKKQAQRLVGRLHRSLKSVLGIGSTNESKSDAAHVQRQARLDELARAFVAELGGEDGEADEAEAFERGKRCLLSALPSEARPSSGTRGYDCISPDLCGAV